EQAAVGIGLRVIGIEADRLVEIGERLFRVPGLGKDRAAHIVGLRIVGMLFNDLGQRRQIGLRRRIDGLILLGRRIAERPAAGERQRAKYSHGESRTSPGDTPLSPPASYD